MCEGICAQIAVPLISSSNNSSGSDQLQNQRQQQDEQQQKEEEQQQQKHLNDLYSDGTEVCFDEDAIKEREQVYNLEVDGLSPSKAKDEHHSLADPTLRRSYSLNVLDQILETLTEVEYEQYFLMGIMSNADNEEYHCANLRDLPDFQQSVMNSQSMADKNDDIERERASESAAVGSSDNNDNDHVSGDDNDDDGDDNGNMFVGQFLRCKRSGLPNLYEFTFDDKEIMCRNANKLQPNISANSSLNSFIKRNGSGESSHFM